MNRLKIDNWPKLIYRISLTLCVASLLLIFWEVFSYWNTKERSEKAAKKVAEQEAIRAAQVVEKKLRQLSDTANAIANDLSSGVLSDTQLMDRIKKAKEQNPQFFGIGAGYVPFAYNPNVKFYAPYYSKKDGKLQLTTDSFYDYTKPEYKWYNEPLTKGNPVWLEPFHAQGADEELVEISVPFYKIDPITKQKTPRGVVYADYSLDDLRELMASLQLGQTGYGFIISKQGTFISHPVRELVISRKNTLDLAKDQKNEAWKILGEKAGKGERGWVESYNYQNGQSSWIFYEPIPSTGWTMGAVFFKQEVVFGKDTFIRKKMRIGMATIAFLFFLIVIISRSYTGQIKRLWLLVYSFNALAILGMGYLWYLTLNEKTYENHGDKNIILFSEPGLNKFLSSREQLVNRNKEEKPVYIPTGVFIQSLEFNTANNVTVTGYIWQKYTKGIHDKISRGFILPESVDKVDTTEYYRQTLGNQETVGWYFRAKLRQQFDYVKYPLDYKDVWLRIWPKDFDKNIILIPDFSSYDMINPTSFPGIEESLVLSGWKLNSSFFKYYLNSYNTNLGIQNDFAKKDVPELYFTVIIRRNLLPIFIANVMPLAVVSFLLFALLMITRKKSDGPLGFTGKDAIQVSAGLLFIVLLNQINLRGSIVAVGIIYLEYFYFVVYLLVLLVIINALLFVRGSKLALINHEDNQVPKLLYWPTLLGLLLFITFGVFY